MASLDLRDRVFPVVGEQAAGLITEIRITEAGVLYQVNWGRGTESIHYAFELSKERLAENA